jgi:uncharacterized protein with HEPN domain
MDNYTKQILKKIVYRSNRIDSYISDHSRESFLADDKTQDAVCMNLLNMGELVKQLSMEFRSEYSDIPWRKIAGLRDMTAHGYDSIQMEDIWTTAKTNVPVLKSQIEKILEQ